MKKISPLFLFAIILQFFFSTIANAHHIYGADISYTYVSGSTYLITVASYQDCNTPVAPSGGVDMISPYLSSSISLGGTISSGKDITPNASSNTCDLCTNNVCSFGFGIKKFTITQQVDLSNYKGCNFTFSYSECCGDQGNVYIECTINRCNGDQNGPVYESDPMTLMCIYNPYDGYQAVTPGNKNDSIRYYFTDPLSAPGSPVGFPYPYSSNNPLPYSGNAGDPFKFPNCYGFHYDSLSGLLQFKPNKLASSYYALKAEEYRKDSTGKYYLFGTSMRRAKAYVINCSGNYREPSITGINGGTADSIYICANIPQSIYFKTYSYSNDTLKLKYNNGTSGYISTLIRPWPIDTLKWTPSNKEISKNPYILTLTVSNAMRPVPVQSQRKFYIFVTDSFPATELNTIDSGCGKYHFSLTNPIDKNYNMTYNWLVDSIPVSTKTNYSFHTTFPGKHAITLILTRVGGCTRIYSDTIWYDSAYRKLMPTIGLCKGSSLTLTTVNQKKILWSPGLGLSDSTINNPIATPTQTTLYTVTGKDNNGCVFTDKTKIVVSDFTIKTSGDKVLCDGSTAKIYATSIPGAKTIWTSGGNILYPTKDTLFEYATQTKTYYKITASYQGCIKADSVSISSPPSMIIGPSVRKVCIDDSVPLHAHGGYNYKWVAQNHPNVALSTLADYTIPRATDIFGYYIKLTANDSLTGCLVNSYVKINVSRINATLKSTSNSICPGKSVTLTASGGKTYFWQLPDGKSSTDSFIIVNPNKTTTYSVIISDTAKGCNVSESQKIYVAPIGSSYPSKTICKGDNTTLNASSGYVYYWYPYDGISNVSIPNPVASPSVTTRYTVTLRDSFTTCSYVDTVTVVVDSDCVWPGDANKDKTADYLDVLNIGVAYGTKGTARDPGTLQWQQYHTLDWSKSTASGINYKHIDCNGDGIIDAKDTAVITANYGKSHNKWTPGTGNPSDPPVYFKFAKDTFYAGDTVVAYLFVGSAAKPIKNVYGVGYQATYIAAPLVLHTETFSSYCDYFCSGHQLDYIRPNFNNFQVEGTSVATNGLGGSNPFGKFAVLKFLLQDSASFHYIVPERIYARLFSVTAIDSSGKEINVYGMDDSAIVLKAQKKNGIKSDNDLWKELKIYPNPANNVLIIETGNIELKHISLFDAIGQVVLINKVTTATNTIDISNLAPGLYFLELKTDKAINTQKVVIQR